MHQVLLAVEQHGRHCDLSLGSQTQKNFGVTVHPLKDGSITLQELLPIVLACAVWGSRWQRLSVRVFCDSLGAVAVMNSGYSKVTRIMHLLCCLFFIRARFDIDLEAVHLPGSENLFADAVSRDKLSVLFTQVPAAKESQTPVPSELVSLLVNSSIDWTSPAWSQQFGSCFHPT